MPINVFIQKNTSTIAWFERDTVKKAAITCGFSLISLTIYLSIRLHAFTFTAIVSLAAVSQASLVSDYSITNGNPNGNWSYGQKATVTGLISLFTVSGTDNVPTPTPSTTDFWSSTSGPALPMIYKLTSGSLNGYNGGVGGIAVGDVVLHPSATEFSVARYTVATTGLYDLNFTYGAGDSFGSNKDVDVYLLHNATTLYSALNTDAGGSHSASLVSLTAGDTLDVVVGAGADGFFYDSTPVNLSVTAVPEPASMAVIGFGVAALARRKKK